MASAQQVGRYTRLKIAKIAILTDFSGNSEIALQYAAVVARAYKANLVLAHAYLPPSCAYAAPDADMAFQAFDACREDLQNRLLKKTEDAYFRDIRCSVLVRIGAPGDLLEDLHNVDLIIVGTSGQTGVGKAAFGSTAETIFRSSRVPVMTVGPQCPRREGQTPVIGTVLYATDLSAEAAIALPYAVSIAVEHNAELVMLHVLDDKDLPFSFDRTMASEEPLEKLQKLMPENVELKHKPQFVIGFGSPEKVILEEAENQKAQLIVMGVRGSGALGAIVNRFWGGTAYHVAVNAHCPVLTIREG